MSSNLSLVAEKLKYKLSKEAQMQDNPVKAQIEQALGILQKVASSMDLSGSDPNQPFIRLGKVIQELEEIVKSLK